jgi:hypothetical protein
MLGLVVLAGASTACNRNKQATPTAEMQRETPLKPANQPLTVTGCLKAGEAADTFVLTSAQSQGGPPAATYQLMGAEGVNLRDHVGHRVEVSGVLNAEKRVAATTPGQAAGEAPTGTSGTPTVSTQTKLDIKQLDVSGVRRVEGRCEM